MNFSLLTELNPILQALIATIFTWFLTTMGAASVFLTKEVNRKVLDGMLGFAAGVMLAASFFSLLLPALDLSVLQNNTAPWLPVAIGFSLGGISIRIAEIGSTRLNSSHANISYAVFCLKKKPHVRLPRLPTAPTHPCPY